MVSLFVRLPNRSSFLAVSTLLVWSLVSLSFAAEPDARPVGADSPPAASTPESEPAAARAILVTEREMVAQLQIFLDQQLFSPGMIDGKAGRFLSRALKRWQRAHGLPETGIVDDNVPLDSVYPVYTFHTVAKSDRKFIGDLPRRTSEQARKKYLPYASYLDFVAERYHASREFIMRLNPGMRFEQLEPGEKIRVPNVEPFRIEEMPPTGNFAEEPGLRARSILIDRRATNLDVMEGERLLASIPIAPGSHAHPTPPGRWRVLGIASMPVFRWDQGVLQRGVRTKNFYLLPAGPRNPVGVAWIALNKPGIGIHGTNNPYSVGTYASHGCMRTANWDIARLCRMVTAGVSIEIR
jgi:lipoprotein-anchoring transpeptidase ErfK/SrfK